MKRSVPWEVWVAALAVLVLIALAVAGCSLAESKTTAEEAAEPQPPTVKVALKIST